MPSLRLACAALCLPLLAGLAQAADQPVATPASAPAYRAYAAEQAEMLVRMTRVLARDIGAGDVDAAINDYPMAHRYLARLAPALALDRDLGRRMDAGAEDFRDRERDAGFSGFHRIEHALFASRSTQGLAIVADRLHDDALLLQKEIATRQLPSDLLIDGAAGMIETVSTRTLVGGSEPYAKTELWDVEASLDGAQAVVAALRPRIEARDPLAAVRLSAAMAVASDELARSKAGCAFKSFDELTRADKASLGAATMALARELSKLKAVPAVD